MVEVFLVFLRLGLTSFGGPIAHLGYFHDEFVKRRKWFDEQAYADLVAICQFLPGPASSQVGLVIGLSRAGPWGAFAAWTGFTFPSALLLAALGVGISRFQNLFSEGLLHGLKLVAVPIVAQALLAMSKDLCYDWKRAFIAIVAAALLLSFPLPLLQVGVILFGGFIGSLFLKDIGALPHSPINIFISKKIGLGILALFLGLVVGLPILAHTLDNHALNMFESFFRAGSLVFGGGHVVLPLLKTAVVDSGWVDANEFMAGYGAAQAIPGPLFTFASYLGAISKIPPSGWRGALICLAAAFLPSFFLVFGTLPFWEGLRRNKNMRAGLQGINAAVVGLLLGAFFDPVCSSALMNVSDYAIAIVGLLLLLKWRWPSWAVVLATALTCHLIG